MEIMKQTRTHGGQVFPFPKPDGIVYETPPCFIWIKEPGVKIYKIEIRGETGGLIWSAETERNIAVPDIIFAPGKYSWNIYGGGFERGWHNFIIASNAVRFIRPTADDVLAGLPGERPRHLFCESDINLLRETRSAELETLRRNVKLALAAPFPEPSDIHLTGDRLKYRDYFSAHRDVCDRNLVALALASVLLNDDEAGERARKLMLILCSWNPDGVCSPDGEWGDEIGLSHSRCFPAVYDLLWNRLNDKERNFIGRTIAAYASHCERRLKRLDFLQNPGDSHCGRIPAYIGEAALVLAGMGIVPEETLRRWLNYALDIYGGMFPHFGGADGGWAEGTFYASSYTKLYLPFFSAVARFSGKNFLDRPFYQNLPHFFLHFAPPGWENHPFADGYWALPDDTEWPGFFAQNPFRVYAERGGNSSALKLAREFSEQLKSPDIFKLHLLDVFLPVMSAPDICLTGPVKNARDFSDAGFISLHIDIKNPERDTALLARASRFGRTSHQHADQGNFAVIHRGTALITPSGYFGSAWGTQHHFKWTQATFAHNCLLIDGQPQPPDFKSTGKIISCGERGGLLYAELDLIDAYPMLEAYTRSFELKETGGGTVQIIVRDKLKAGSPVTVSYLNHTLSEPVILKNGQVTVSRGGFLMSIEPVSGLINEPQMTDKFTVGVNDGVPPEHWINVPPQYHLRWETEAAAEHDISVIYIIKNKN